MVDEAAVADSRVPAAGLPVAACGLGLGGGLACAYDGGRPDLHLWPWIRVAPCVGNLSSCVSSFLGLPLMVSRGVVSAWCRSVWWCPRRLLCRCRGHAWRRCRSICTGSGLFVGAMSLVVWSSRSKFSLALAGRTTVTPPVPHTSLGASLLNPMLPVDGVGF